MKKNNILNDNKDDRFGFTSALNTLNKPLPSEPSIENKVNEPSKTWRSFFQQLENKSNETSNQNNNSIDLNQKNMSVLLKTKNLNELTSSNQLDKGSSILSRLLGNNNENLKFDNNNINDILSFNINNNEKEKTNNIEELYSVFTKKNANNVKHGSLLTLADKVPSTTYSPPRFSAAVPLATSVSAATKISKSQTLFAGKPYALTSSSKRKNLFLKNSYNSMLQLPVNLMGIKLIIFTVLYSPSSTRKHKKWENDGYLYFDLTENQMCLTKALEKYPIARHPTPRLNFRQISEEYVPGFQSFIGGYEIQIQEEIFSNVNEAVIKEDYDQELNMNQSVTDDSGQFMDETMENYLVKIESDQINSIGFGLFNDVPTSSVETTKERIELNSENVNGNKTNDAETKTIKKEMNEEISDSKDLAQSIKAIQKQSNLIIKKEIENNE